MNLDEKRIASINKLRQNPLAIIVFLALFLVAVCIMSMIEGTMQLFYICSLFFIVSTTAIITKNRYLASISIAGIPAYVEVLLLDIRDGGDVNWVHLLNLSLCLITLILFWKEASPIVILITTFTYIFYLLTFEISFGYDYYHSNLKLAPFFLLVVVFNTTIAWILRNSRKSFL